MSGIRTVKVVSDDLRRVRTTTRPKAEWDTAADAVRDGKTVWVKVPNRQSIQSALGRRGLKGVSIRKHEGGFVVWKEAS